MSDLATIINSFLPILGTGLIAYLMQQSLFKRLEKVEELERRINRIEMREELKKELLKNEV